MKDLHDNPAFISAEHYAAGSTLAVGEVGQLGQFRLIVNPRMFKWSGGGAAIADADRGSFYNDGSRYDVFPILVVGDEAFVTITFKLLVIPSSSKCIIKTWR